jgi:hypothetical protein
VEVWQFFLKILLRDVKKWGPFCTYLVEGELFEACNSLLLNLRIQQLCFASIVEWEIAVPSDSRLGRLDDLAPSGRELFMRAHGEAILDTATARWYVVFRVVREDGTQVTLKTDPIYLTEREAQADPLLPLIASVAERERGKRIDGKKSGASH